MAEPIKAAPATIEAAIVSEPASGAIPIMFTPVPTTHAVIMKYITPKISRSADTNNTATNISNVFAKSPNSTPLFCFFFKLVLKQFKKKT